MVSYSPPEIDWDSFPDTDGKPMAENDVNRIQMIGTIFALGLLFEGRDDVYVSGNLLVYYNPDTGRDHCSPDALVVFGARPGHRDSWKTFVEGRFPQVVFEFVSPSTRGNDIGEKVALYGRLGAHEYYVYAVCGEIEPPLRAYHRRGAGLQPLPLARPDRVSSPLLGAELRVVDGWLRLIDPANGLPIPLPDEEHAARLAAEARLAGAESARRHAEDRVEEERLRAEQERGRADGERLAREAVEGELARLRALLAEREG